MLPAPPFQLLERYDVVEEIGRGGHAVVFRAHDRTLARDVAIKVLREDVVGADIVRRFAQEIQLLATLEHAHILHVHDSGTVDGRPFVVMELAPQRTLAHRLAREPQLPIADAVQVAREVGSALAHAHARGILHRDVKPENILLGSGGAVLADFGIARVTGEHGISRITSTGEAVGTVQYMSPEQLCAEPLDARSDQYAMGLVFYEMLAGVRPHAAATIDGLRALRLTGQQRPLGVHRSAVAPALEGIIARTMAIAPADRFRSMDEFVMALDVLATAEIPGGSGGYEIVRTPVSARTPVGTDAAVTPSASATAGVSETPPRSLTVRTRRIAAGVAVIAAVSATPWLWSLGADAWSDGGDARAGSVSVSLTASDDSLARAMSARLRNELAAWSDVSVREGSSRRGVQVATSVTRLGDSVQVRLQVRDSAGAAPRDVRRLIALRAFDSATAVTASMTREILAGRTLDSLRGLDGIPTRSLPALRAFVRGFDLLLGGQLDSASAAFRAARDAAPGFAAAHLWAAQSAAWAKPRESAAWQPDVDGALRIGGLDAGSTLLARALARMAKREYPEACDAYRAAERVDAVRFEALVGLGECQRLDDLVVRTPMGLRFRSSHWGALQAYRAAVDIAPTSMLLSSLLPRMQRMTYASGASQRNGSSGQTTFRALVELVHDTLAHVPLLTAVAPYQVPATWEMATRRGRALDIALTRAWANRFPADPRAWFANALALENAGYLSDSDSSGAPAVLERARRLPAGGSLQLPIALARARIHLRRGAIDRALQSAQEILEAYTPTGRADSTTFVALAAFTGQAESIERWWPRDSLQHSELSIPAGALLDSMQRATLAGRCERSRALWERLNATMKRTTPATSLGALRERWIVPAVRFAVPCLGHSVLDSARPMTRVDEAIHLLSRDDRTGARLTLQRLRNERAGASLGSVTWDFQDLEAWVAMSVGDTTAAIDQLLAAVEGLSSMSVYTLEVPQQSFGLRHALQLLHEFNATANSRSTVNASRRDRIADVVGRSARMTP